MQITVRNLLAEEVGTVELDDAVFGVEVRPDILQRVVVWQLAKRRAGTHKVKTRAEIARTGAKIYKQKGTGRARHGSRRPNIFRGGGVAHGPTPRDHATDLTKKVRALGLRCALSSKAKDGKLVVVDQLRLDEPKTKLLVARLEKLGIGSALVVDGATAERNIALASRNLPLIDLLPAEGANVYDILRRDVLVLTTAAVEQLEARLKPNGQRSAATPIGDETSGSSAEGRAPAPVSAPSDEIETGAAVSVAPSVAGDLEPDNQAEALR